MNNRTGLPGYYSVELNFSPDGLAATDTRGDEPPQFLTALQDSIERPSEY